MLPGGLEMALSYLYGHGVPAVQVCHFPSGEWQHGDGLGRKGTCTREADGGWVLAEAATMAGPGYVAAPRRPDVRMAADTTIVVTIHPDFTGSVDSGAAKPEPAPTAQFGTLGYGSSVKSSVAVSAVFQDTDRCVNSPSAFHSASRQPELRAGMSMLHQLPKLQR